MYLFVEITSLDRFDQGGRCAGVAYLAERLQRVSIGRSLLIRSISSGTAFGISIPRVRTSGCEFYRMKSLMMFRFATFPNPVSGDGRKESLGTILPASPAVPFLRIM